MKLICVYLMSAVMTNIPNLVFAEGVEASTRSGMIATSLIVSELSRDKARTKVEDFLKQEDVLKQFVANGISPEEAKIRLALLSETEMKHLATQVDQARAGGDILITILIVVLIIFLIKRI